MASTAVTPSSSSTTIQIYKPDDGLRTKVLTFRPNPTKFYKVSKARRIIEHVNTPTPREDYFIVEPASIDMEKGIGPILSQLPGELRNIIYSYLLRNGNCQFLRASKALHKEGSALMAKDGVYRINFTLGFATKPNYPLPSQRIADTIRNLSVHINGGFNCSGPQTAGKIPGLWLLRAFGGLGLVRGRCDVFFEVHRATNLLDLAILSSHLRLLSGFETVAVWPEIHWGNLTKWANGPSDSLLKCAGDAWPHWCEIRHIDWEYFKHLYFFKTLELSRNLGCGRIRQRQGMRIVHHPRKALEDAEKYVACRSR